MWTPVHRFLVSICRCAHKSAFVLGFLYQCMHARLLHSPVLLSILASMLVYMLRFVCMDPLVYTLKYISSCACAGEVWVCACTDPGQLLLQGLLGGLRAAVQLGSLLTHNLSQPLYSAPFCLQQLTRLAYTHVHTQRRTHPHKHTYTHVHICLCVHKNNETHMHTRTHTHMDRERMAALVGLGNHS